MGVHILVDESSANAVLYSSTSMIAFGPVWDSLEQAVHFLAWFEDHCPEYPDVRVVPNHELHAITTRYLTACPHPCGQADPTCCGPVGHSPLLAENVCRKHYHEWAEYGSACVA